MSIATQCPWPSFADLLQCLSMKYEIADLNRMSLPINIVVVVPAADDWVSFCRKLKALVKLRLAENDLRVIPPEIGNYPSLILL